MDTTTSGAADTASSEVIIHALRADQLVRMARSEQGAEVAKAAPRASGSTAR
jgi:hypothetical protein